MLQMKVQQSQEIFAMYSIWAGIRTSVPSMNPISSSFGFEWKKYIQLLYMGISGGKVANHALQQVLCSGADLATGEEYPCANRQETWQPQQLCYLESAIQASRGRGPWGLKIKKKK